MKAILVMEIPENCLECPLLNGSDNCIMQDEDANFASDTWSDLKNGCPLVPMPERKIAVPGYEAHIEAKGWNACLGAVEGSKGWQKRKRLMPCAFDDLMPDRRW